MRGVDHSAHRLDGTPTAWTRWQVVSFLGSRYEETVHSDYDWDYEEEPEQAEPCGWTAMVMAWAKES